MSEARMVALLRGINVGGNRIVPMAELREFVAGLGFRDVGAYIQSGKVVFSAAQTAGRVANALESRDLVPIRVRRRSDRPHPSAVESISCGVPLRPRSRGAPALPSSLPLATPAPCQRRRGAGSAVLAQGVRGAEIEIPCHL